MPTGEQTHEQSAFVGHMLITVYQAAREAREEEVRLLRNQLVSTQAAWRDLWEKAGRPAGAPDQ